MQYTRDELLQFCEWHFGELPPCSLSDEDIYYQLSGDGFDFPPEEENEEENEGDHDEDDEEENKDDC